MKLWNWIIGRHSDGTRHEWVNAPLPTHSCGGYCHHEAQKCACGETRIVGHFVEEVR